MNMIQTVQQQFNGRRRLRPWSLSHYGGFQAVKAHPLAICAFGPDEGGTVSTNLNVRLAPLSGFCRSKAYLDVVQVFVPYQAAEKLELDAQDDAGVTEMTKRRLMANQGIGLEEEGTITKAAYLHPRSIGGVKKVNKTARLAYLAAVNHLRKSAYFGAAEVDKTETAILPAILTANVLERYNGVLEPERHIDGAINLTGELPVKGIGALVGSGHPAASQTMRESGSNDTVTVDGWDVEDYGSSLTTGQMKLVVEKGPEGDYVPNIRVDLGGAAELTLRDMIASRKLDGLIRQFARYREQDPIHGEEVIERALYGISCDFDDNCQVLYRQVYEMSPQHQRPSDGASINDVSANFEVEDRFATIVPRSELGGQLVTIVMVKPVEVVAEQPDPLQTEQWQLINRVHDETELDEKLLTRADLESNIAAVDEDTPAFWVGHNSLKHGYFTQGGNDQQTHATEQKSTMWQYVIPTSVTPENVSYPAGGIDMYPFYNWNGAHAEYTIIQNAAISTPLAKGPNPIERIQLFAADPTLLTNEA